MSDKKSSMSIKENISIVVSGSGINTWAKKIDNKIFKKLISINDKEKRLEIIENQNEKAEGDLVCWGISTDSNCKVYAKIDNVKIPLKIVRTGEGYELPEAMRDLGIDQDEKVVGFNEDKQISLGAEFNMDKTSHIYLDCIEWKSIILDVSIPVKSEEFDLKKLGLLVVNLDQDTPLSKATYRNNILDTDDDIIGVNYDGTDYLFQCTSKGSKEQLRWIISKDKGDWRINYDLDFNYS